MSTTKILFWFHLPNFPLHFWHFLVFEDFGNYLENYIKATLERAMEGLYTYVCICVNININKGLMKKVILKWRNFQYTQVLDYEKTMFHCRLFHLRQGHYQATFSQVCVYPPRKKGQTQIFFWNIPNNYDDQNDET